MSLSKTSTSTSTADYDSLIELLYSVHAHAPVQWRHHTDAGIMTLLVLVRVRVLTVSKCSLVSLSNQCFVVLLVMERRLAGLDDGHSTRRIRFKSFCRSDLISSLSATLITETKRNETLREPVSISALFLCIPQSQSQLRRVTSTSRSCSRAVLEKVTSCAASVRVLNVHCSLHCAPAAALERRRPPRSCAKRASPSLEWEPPLRRDVYTFMRVYRYTRM